MSDSESFLSKTDIKLKLIRFYFQQFREKGMKGLSSKEKDQVRNLLRSDSRRASWK